MGPRTRSTQTRTRTRTRARAANGRSCGRRSAALVPRRERRSRGLSVRFHSWCSGDCCRAGGRSVAVVTRPHKVARTSRRANGENARSGPCDSRRATTTAARSGKDTTMPRSSEQPQGPFVPAARLRVTVDNLEQPVFERVERVPMDRSISDRLSRHRVLGVVSSAPVASESSFARGLATGNGIPVDQRSSCTELSLSIDTSGSCRRVDAVRAFGVQCATDRQRRFCAGRRAG